MSDSGAGEPNRPHDAAGVIRLVAGRIRRRASGPAGALAEAVTSASRAAAMRISGPRATVYARPPATELGRGVVLVGTVWCGGDAEPVEGVVVIDGHGRVDYVGPDRPGVRPAGLPVHGGPGHWIGPGMIDAHVHLAFGPASLRTGLVAVRDLGAPPELARRIRTGHPLPTGDLPMVAAAGPVLTASGGYPSRSWGAAGFSTALDSPAHARQVVQRVAAAGADVVKIALEPGGEGWPVPSPAVVAAVVAAAHDAGLAVVAHALTVEMVGRALDAGVDELAHTPTERLPDRMIERIATSGVGVVSTLQTFFSAGVGAAAAANGAELHRAGVTLRYGTDLGNAGTLPGVDPRELDRLADTGLGRLGALRAATEHAASAPGIRHRTGKIERGRLAALVLLGSDPLVEPGAWRTPSLVIADGRLRIT